jgi:hypothetical protein
MKMNEFADRSFKLLRSHPALPACSEMFAEPFHAARRQLAIRRENKVLISLMSVSKPHTSPLSRTCQTRQGPLQRKGDGTERNIEHVCDFPIAKTFRPENQASPILFRQRTHDGQNPLPRLVAGHLVFGVGIGIGHQIRQEYFFVYQLLNARPLVAASLQCLIVGDAEYPGSKVSAGTPLLQMPEQCKEHFLDNILSVLGRQTEADHVAEQSIPQLIEQADDLFHQGRRRRLTRSLDGSTQWKQG